MDEKEMIRECEVESVLDGREIEDSEELSSADHTAWLLLLERPPSVPRLKLHQFSLCFLHLSIRSDSDRIYDPLIAQGQPTPNKSCI